MPTAALAMNVAGRFCVIAVSAMAGGIGAAHDAGAEIEFFHGQIRPACGK
jgi:hypothetical protein